MNEFLLSVLKSIGSGLAAIGVTGAGIGIGLIIVVFAVYITAVGKNPEMEKNLFPHQRKIKRILVLIFFTIITVYLLIYQVIIESETMTMVRSKTSSIAFELLEKNYLIVENKISCYEYLKKNSNEIILVSIAVVLGGTALYCCWPLLSSLIWPVVSVTTDDNRITQQTINNLVEGAEVSEPIAMPSAATNVSSVSIENPFTDPNSPEINRFLNTNSIPFENMATATTSLVRAVDQDEIDEVFRQHLLKILGNYLKPGAIEKYKDFPIEKLIKMIKRTKEVLSNK